MTMGGGSVNLGTAYADVELRLSKLEEGFRKASAGFDRFGRDANAKLKRVGEGMETLGRTMTLSLTAPIVALGTAAVRSATQMDNLKRGLISVVGSSAEAERQMKRLKEAAKLPGIDFKEAVQGSIRLQAAGFSAQQAERSIKAFGNALARVGGSKDDLQAVLYNLTQIASMGKLTGDELRETAARVPDLNKAMKAAFGTSSTEALQKMGVTGQQAIEKIVTELLKLPQASNSAQNSFDNFRQAADEALSKIGETLLPSVTRALEGSIKKLEEFSKWWGTLGEQTQSQIIGGLGIVAAIGGITLALGKVITTIAAVMDAFTKLKLAAVAAGGTIAGALSAAARLGGPAAGIAALTAAQAAGRGGDFQRGTAGMTPADMAAELRKRRTDVGLITNSMRGPVRDDNRPAQAALTYAQQRIRELRAALQAQGLNEAGQPFDPNRPGKGNPPANIFNPLRDSRLKSIREELTRLTQGQFAGERVSALNTFKEDVTTVGMVEARRLYDATIKDIGKRQAEAFKKAMDEKFASGAMTKEFNLTGAGKGGATGGFFGQLFSGGMHAIQQQADAAEKEMRAFVDAWSELADDAAQKQYELGQSGDQLALDFVNHWEEAADASREAARQSAEAWYASYMRIAETHSTFMSKFEEALQTARDFFKQWEEAADEAADKVAEKEKKRAKVGFDWGKELGDNMADAFSESFREGLDKLFGRNPFMQALAKTIARWFDMMVQKALDTLADPNSTGAEKGKAGMGLIGSLLGSAFGPIGGILGGLFGGLFAEGGTMPGRKWSIVGERGPELVYPSADTQVVPFAGAAAAGMGGVVVNMGGVVIRETADVDRVMDRMAWRIQTMRRVRGGRP